MHQLKLLLQKNVQIDSYLFVLIEKKVFPNRKNVHLINVGPTSIITPFGTSICYWFCRTVIYIDQDHTPQHKHNSAPLSPFLPDATQGYHQNKEVGASR